MQRHRRAGWFTFGAAVLLFVAAEAGAEQRTWTAASGGFKVDADFVELVGSTTVRLKLGSGELREVPLDKLSAADQEYVRKQTTSSPTASTKGNSDNLARIDREATRCRKAQDALRIYKIFAASPEATEAERAAAAVKIAELQPQAEQNLFRVGGKWVTEEEAIAIRKRANELMKQGLEVLKLGQEDTFRKKFAEASALEPEEIRAEYILAVMYSTSNRNKNNTRAVQYYQACLKRDPTNLGVLNNLALMLVRAGEYHGAMTLWKQAMAISPDQRICHNIGKLVKAASNQSVNVSKAVLDQLTELYLSNVGEGKLKPTDPARGWLHLLTDDAGLDLELDATTAKSSVVPATSDEGPIVGGGSGFVIDPHHIVTNAHVVAGGTSFEIQFGNKSSTETISATVVATSTKPDLAILRCDTQLGPGLTLDPTPVGRGTDIMVLGYPEMFELGASLKATRGVISGLPTPALDNLYLYDAVTNGGNSGGPVFDVKGNVVAVHCIGVNTASRYGGGIPADQLLTFLQKNLPTYRQKPAAEATLSWTAVDEKVSPSTVLVWVRKRDGAAATTMIAGTLEDQSCLGCKGLALTKCLNGGCVNGMMSVRVGGGSVKTRCPICMGTGMFACLQCEGQGIDKEIAAARAAAGKSVAGSGRPVVKAAPVATTGDPIRNHPNLPDSIADIISNDLKARPAESERSTWRSSAKTYREEAPPGGLLIALDLCAAEMAGRFVLTAIRPTFITRTGRVEGNWIGTPDDKVLHLETFGGTAIGTIRLNVQQATIAGLSATGNRIMDTGLEIGSSSVFSSFGIVNKDRRDEVVPTRAGEFVVGIVGGIANVGGVDVLTGLGVLHTHVKPAQAASGAVAPLDLTKKAPSLQIPNDPSSRHLAINAQLAAHIKTAITQKTTVDTSVGSSFGDEAVVRDFPPTGGVLIGFDLSFGNGRVSAVRPLYNTLKGKLSGAIIGTPTQQVTHLEAKPGYAISRFVCKAGLYVDSISISYAKLTPNGLDLTDTYEGPCYGEDGGSIRPMVGGSDGQLIVGIIAATRREQIADIGGMVVPAKAP